MNDRPNIVILMTDQHRAGMSAREGFPLDTTPFLDSLTDRGADFRRAYTFMPVCAPARVSLLTGRYPSANRVRTNWNVEDAYYQHDLFDILRGLGYATALVGKNHSHLSRETTDHWYECGHLGIDSDPGRSAQEATFDSFLKTTSCHLSAEPTPFPVECQIPYRLVRAARQWVDSVAGSPFLLWLSFPEPHNPYQVPEPYFSMFPPETLPPPAAGPEVLPGKGFKWEWCRQSFARAFRDYEQSIPRARSNYLGMLRLLDDCVRQFFDHLQGRGLLERTLVFVLADHGDFVGDYGLLRKGPGLPEALCRIPMQVVGPGVALKQRPDAFVSICDVFPTICEAVGLELPVGVQGRSLWPMLAGRGYPPEEFASAFVEHGFGGLNYTGDNPLDPEEDGLDIARDGCWGSVDCLNSRTQSGTMRMVRAGDWKLICDAQWGGELYDLAADPFELANLYDDTGAAAKRAELTAKMLRWMIRLQDPLPLPRKRYVMKRDPRNYWTPHSE